MRRYASTAPYFGDIAQVQVVLVFFGIAQGRGFSIGRGGCSLPDVRGAQDTESFRVRGHDAVFDSVVHHLHKVASAVWPAVQITLFSGSITVLPSECARDVAHSRSQCREDWVETLDDLVLSANHHAVPALQAPHSAAGADIHIVDSRGKFLRTPYIVNVVRITPVDEDVSRFELRQKIGDGLVDNRSRHHQPNRPWLGEFLYEICQRSRARRLILHQFVHSVRRPVEYHTVVSFIDKAPHHVGAHSSQTDHSKLH